jgi:precorrin-3B C17-methyltransferase
MHDFASISLSDRLTPWRTIEERLDAAARADFVIVLYNPKSGTRRDHIRKAQQTILRYRTPATPVGVVRAAMREHESVIVTDLAHMPFDEIDMQTTVIVGNSKTHVWNNLMITPRGYENKEKWGDIGGQIGEGAAEKPDSPGPENSGNSPP